MLLALILVFALQQATFAVGELFGEFTQIAVERETLNIDLRGLASDSNKVKIEARYRLANSGGPVERRFWLAAENAVVTFDGVVVKLEKGLLPLPLDFRPSDTTPGVGVSPPLYYSVRLPTEGLTFSLTVPTGRHELLVRYDAEASVSVTDAVTLFWQLGYVLAPARGWSSYNGLDLYVYLPVGWEGSCSLPLERGRDMLVGAWNELPQQNIALTVRRSIPPLLRLSYVAAAAAFVVAISGTLLVYHFLRKKLLSLLVPSLASMLLMSSGYLLDVARFYEVLGDQLSPAYQARPVAVSAAAFVVAFVVCVVTYYTSTRRKGRCQQRQ
ncbi:MAG: hypothetical protein RMM17_10530 [Acidobacteriota bacterium]|nr:hypothetical protein [Blastocatellia bacterium]MDW8413106.1 hypothetical protein [Acidobacteriota bacterium]